MPKPIMMLPTGIPILGLTHVTKATRRAKSIGRGCERSGTNEKAKAIAINVATPAMNFIRVVSSTRSLAAVSLRFTLVPAHQASILSDHMSVRPFTLGLDDGAAASTTGFGASSFGFFCSFFGLLNKRFKRDVLPFSPAFKGKYLKPYFA